MTQADVKQVDAIFEGGGVKGVGLVGAVAVTEERGYSFQCMAGTSAGAIVASLLAAGYRAPQLKLFLDRLDYGDFCDGDALDRLPMVGRGLNICFEKGIFQGRFLQEWLRELLLRAPRRVRTFADLRTDEDDPRYRYRLQVIATDISNGRLLTLPGDIARFGIEPDALDVAFAVRMSMSIPFFYEPVILKDGNGEDVYIVDGGVLSNFPVWIFDDGTSEPPWPTFGYKLVEPGGGGPQVISGAFSLAEAVLRTMLEAHDARYLEAASFVRTVAIPTLGVRTTEFDLSREKSEALYQSGRNGAEAFFAQWDFDAYKARFRQAKPACRRIRELASGAGAAAPD